MKVIFQNAKGKRHTIDMMTLPTDHSELLRDGLPVTFELKQYVFNSWLDDDTILYVQKTSWHELNPLFQLDQRLKRLGGKHK